MENVKIQGVELLKKSRLPDFIRWIFINRSGRPENVALTAKNFAYFAVSVFTTNSV
jgi:hypothetical protein